MFSKTQFLSGSVPGAVRVHWRIFATALALLGLAACSSLSPVPPFEPGPFVGFQVPHPLRPFAAEGAVRLTYQGSKESGDLVLRAGVNGAYRLQLLAPITGAVLLDVGFDRNWLRVLDYGNKTRLEERNTPEVRQRLFGLDLTPEEFQVLFTGRVDDENFTPVPGGPAPASTGATATSADTPWLRFAVGSAQHRFRLNAQGLPETWEKRDGERLAYRVHFVSYAPTAAGAGELLLPRSVKLFHDDQEAPVLVLGIRTFTPGAGAETDLDALPPGADMLQRVHLR